MASIIENLQEKLEQVEKKVVDLKRLIEVEEKLEAERDSRQTQEAE